MKAVPIPVGIFFLILYTPEYRKIPSILLHEFFKYHNNSIRSGNTNKHSGIANLSHYITVNIYCSFYYHKITPEGRSAHCKMKSALRLTFNLAHFDMAYFDTAQHKQYRQGKRSVNIEKCKRKDRCPGEKLEIS